MAESARQLDSNQGPCNIALLLNSGHDHTRHIALGAVDYHRANRSVRIVGDGYRPLMSWERLDSFQGDGLIAVANSHQELYLLESSGIPFVLAGARFLRNDHLLVASNNKTIGRMAAEHMVSCGIKSFLFVGKLHWDDETLRKSGFQDALEAQSMECGICNVAIGSQPDGFDASIISDCLQNQIRFPVGVFCPNATIARATVLACQQLELTVPDKVSIVAVNNDQILCETSEPPLTSIVQHSRRIGFVAAQKLYQQLRENGNGDSQNFVEPLRISIRRSSDLMLVGNPLVESSLRFMRDNVTSDIEIQDVADHVNASRRTLELKFRETINSTPRQALLKMQLTIAKSLLFESEIPITQIALRSGFGSSQVFSSVFKKEFGMTPSQYRSDMKSGLSDCS